MTRAKPATRSKLTASREDYIKAIAELSRKDGHAHTMHIARELNVKAASVTAALRELARAALIVYVAGQPVVLTEYGEEVARNILRRHELLTRFLHETLGVEKVKARKTACKIEHDFDDEILQRVETIQRSLGVLAAALSGAENFEKNN